MISRFDKQKLLDFLQNFYTAAEIRLSIFDDDFNMVAEYPTQLPALCSLIRKTEKGEAACRECDKAAYARARKLQTPHIYQCHAGITEAVTPIRFGIGERTVVLGYTILAHMLPEENYDETIKNICRCCAQYGLDKETVLEAVKQMQIYSNEKINASMRILDAIASYLEVKKYVKWKPNNFVARLDEFIEQNMNKIIDSRMLCRHFYISRTKLYHVSKKNLDMGITQYVFSKKMEKAKQLLCESNQTVETVAQNIGYDDYIYFKKIFKKHIGISPLEFKKEQINYVQAPAEVL